MSVLREMSNPMRSNAKMLDFKRLDGGNQKLMDPVNIVKAIHNGAPTCVVNAHLNYVTATRIDVWNGDPEHVIDVIP